MTPSGFLNSAKQIRSQRTVLWPIYTDCKCHSSSVVLVSSTACLHLCQQSIVRCHYKYSHEPTITHSDSFSPCALFSDQVEHDTTTQPPKLEFR